MKQFILHNWILCLLVVMTGCSKDDAGAVDSAQSPIEFTTDGPALFITRSVIENNSHLQAAGFGVLAYMKGTNGATACYDGGDNWNSGAPNFMYNQQVSWSTDHWTYSPVKYWPNDNNPADGSGAEGSQTNSYVSFFAYAPYTDLSSSPAIGITGLSANSATTAPTITYVWDAEADLLYDAKPDCYKTDAAGDGRVSGAVQFSFKHALALVKFKVRRSSGFSLAVTLKSLTVSGFLTRGTFDLGAKTPSWSSTTGSDSKTFDPEPDMKVTKDTEATAHEIGSSLMIPATPELSAPVLSYTINYSVGPHENTKTDNISLTSYEMGYQYTIIFTIDADGIIVDTEKYTEQW